MRPDSTDQLLADLRAENGDLRARVAQLQAELDQVQRVPVLLCPRDAMLDAMEASTGEEAGTVIRATDEPGLEFVLGSDRLWRRR